MMLARTVARSLAAFALAAFAAAPLRAADAPTRPESPGWYRMQIGRLTVTALRDGTMEVPIKEAFDPPGPAGLKAMLDRAELPAPIPMSVNAFVIDTGKEVVMVDTGTGTLGLFGPGLGRMLGNLRAAGYTPGEIDEIYVTHMHGDHVGGLAENGRAVFPKAIVRADVREAAHYLSREKMAAATLDKEDFQNAIAAFEPYVRSGRFRPFEGATALAAGVRALPARGHTAGHTVYVVRSEGEELVLWGDVMHIAAVQFAQPSASVSFDAVPAEAAATRERVFADAARDHAWIAGAHIGFPGIGKLHADGHGGYDWVPVAEIRGH